MTIFLDEVENMLVEWGKSSRASTVRLGCKPSVFANMKGSTLKALSIDDDTASEIDSIVSSMRKVDEKMYEVVTDAFIMRYSDRRIAEQQRCSATKINKLRCAGIAYVAGQINQKFT